METIGLTGNMTVEVISAYSASSQVLPSVAVTPGWYAIGAFFMSATADARLSLIGGVSAVGLLMRARLFDVTTGALVSGATTADIDSTVDERAVSPEFPLTGGRVYQIQVEVTGFAGGFGTVKESSLF